jgi:hypothetical protein
MSLSPWQIYPELTEERLSIISEGLLNVRHDTHSELATRLDDNYSRACATFGRQRQWLMQEAKSGRYKWLALSCPTMDLTVNIGSIPVRFFTDDHDSPRKLGYFRRNDADQLFSSDETQPVMFRFVVEPSLVESEEDRVFFLGYNIFQEVVVEWRYRPKTTTIYPIESDVPPAVVQSDAEVEIKSPDEKESGDAANGSDKKNGTAI